ncbi:baseplate J/gp47 family protein [Streptomyces malaysiensis]|uniref:T4-like baseplate wedge n=1 Tax=Streptomyces malaysiensis TaxID=92644 RepID=A0A7X5X7G0_STRMQ|nr:baseplate J/gp47 family protein [Streptomyces malaysiensis]NIY68039.1 t4-like baseplate wedge [Streptomyces malaysiensis]
MPVDSGLVAQIDYTSRDFTGYRDALLQYASQILPEWTSRSPADFGVVMVELFSYLGDIISFYQDRIQDEAFLATATQRSSVIAIAQQLGYQPHPAIPATGQVAFSPTPGLVSPVTLEAGTQVITSYIPSLDRPVTYELAAPVTVPAYVTPVPQVIGLAVEGVTQGERSLVLYPSTSSGPATTVRVEDIGVSDGTKTQVFTLAQSPVLLDTVRVILDDGTGGTEWTRVPDFLLVRDSDQVFTAETDDQGVTRITLGDGTNGVIPATGIKITSAYRTGGGSYGNIPQGSIVDLADGLPGVVVSGSTPMTGGADEEPIDQIRANAPRHYRAQGRAVSPQDYADLALAVEGVADARAVVRSSSAVTIYVIGPNGVLPSEGQRDAVAQYVQERALAGVVVNVINGSLIPVSVGSSAYPTLISVLPRYRRDTVTLAVQQAIQQVFRPPETSFGARISLSHLYRAIQDVPGVDWAVIQMMARTDLPQSGTADVVFRESEIPVTGSIVVTASGGV